MQTIRQLRQERGWSQLEVAIRLGVTVSTVSLWERGLRVPTLVHQHRLARLFGISVTTLAVGQTRHPARYPRMPSRRSAVAQHGR